MVADIYAYVGGIAAMVSFVPQLIKAWSTRSTRDISWMMIALTLVSAGGYELYALALDLLPVIIMNGTFLATTLVLLALKVKFDREEGGTARETTI